MAEAEDHTYLPVVQVPIHPLQNFLSGGLSPAVADFPALTSPREIPPSQPEEATQPLEWNSFYEGLGCSLPVTGEYDFERFYPPSRESLVDMFDIPRTLAQAGCSNSTHGVVVRHGHGESFAPDSEIFTPYLDARPPERLAEICSIYM